MELEELKNVDGGHNDGGLKINFFVARNSEIATFPTVPENPATFAESVTITDPFVFNVGGRFYNIQGEVEKNSLDANSQGEAGSLSAENPLSITIKKASPALQGFLEEIKNDHLVWLAEDLEGNTKTIGSEGLPAMIQEFKIIGGASVSDPRNVNIVIKSVGRIAPFYTGPISESPAV